jgi:hypothetical protein
MDIATPKQAETATDTLPDFLKEFANDSTIHINWAYGIPFIIDDSVPMFLPPIDKNPEGYVSNKTYNKPASPTILSTIIDVRCSNKVPACGINNPLDSLLWLNKCINDLLSYIDSPFIMGSHHYTYVVQIYPIGDSKNIIVFGITQLPDWTCHADSTPLKQIGVLYTFDCDGTLLGKMHVEEPVTFKKGRPSGEMNKVYPWAEKISSMLREKGQRHTLIRLFFTKLDPNRPTPCPCEI